MGHLPAHTILRLCLHQAVEQIRQADEVNTESVANRFHAQRDRQMGLTHAGRTHHINAHVLETATVYYPWHPLFGQTLRVHKRMRDGHREHLFVELVDGTRSVGNAAMLHPNVAGKKSWMVPMQALLDDVEITALLARLREVAGKHADSEPGLTLEIIKEAEYLATNASRMNYPRFRAMGLFVGSGVRLKRPGMFWTVRGANDITALRCCRLNGRFEEYWEEARVA